MSDMALVDDLRDAAGDPDDMVSVQSVTLLGAAREIERLTQERDAAQASLQRLKVMAEALFPARA